MVQSELHFPNQTPATFTLNQRVDSLLRILLVASDSVLRPQILKLDEALFVKTGVSLVRRLIAERRPIMDAIEIEILRDPGWPRPGRACILTHRRIRAVCPQRQDSPSFSRRFCEKRTVETESRVTENPGLVHDQCDIFREERNARRTTTVMGVTRRPNTRP